MAEKISLMRLSQLATELEMNGYQCFGFNILATSTVIYLDFLMILLWGYSPQSLKVTKLRLVNVGGDLAASHQATELLDAAN